MVGIEFGYLRLASTFRRRMTCFSMIVEVQCSGIDPNVSFTSLECKIVSLVRH